MAAFLCAGRFDGYELKAKSLAVAESFRYCKGFSSFI